MPDGPSRVRWTGHARVKAQLLNAPPADIEDAVIEGHGSRRSNRGPAAWRLIVGRWVILYDYPDEDDASSARIVTLWRHR